MAGITISSGSMSFEETGMGADKAAKQALNVVVVGDFSGRESRGIIDAASLGRRKLHRIDKDSIDDVFAKLGVSLALPVSDEPLSFSDLDQLHPDYLFQNLDVFARYRQILRQLKSSSQYQTAVEALTAEGIVAQEQPAANTFVKPEPDQAGLLDQLLTDKPAAQTFDVATLIREAVAPYVEPKADPKAEHYIAAVERALAASMRELMHASAFKALEASWRALDQLNRRVDSDRDVHLHLLDCSKNELLADYEAGSQQMERAMLGERLLAQQGVRGTTGIDCLLLDMSFAATAPDVAVLNYMGELAATLGARLLASASVQLLGQQQFTDLTPAIAQQAPVFSSLWQTLRQRDFAQNIFLTVPGFLLRLPYGRHSKSIESFQFEELLHPGEEANYLWGNGGYLLLIGWLQTRQRARHRGKTEGTWAYIEQLPLHVYRDSEGDECIMPSAAVFFGAEQVSVLEQQGLIPLQSVNNTDQVFIARWVPLANL